MRRWPGDKAVDLLSTGYITIPHNAAFALIGDFTLEAWVKPTNRSNNWWVVAKTLSGVARP